MARRSLASWYLVDMHLNDEEEENEELLLLQLEEERLANKSSSRGHCGSVMGYQIVTRDLIEDHERLYLDYFADPPKYGPKLFRRRFRMKQALFLRMHDVVVAHDNYFVQKRNAARHLGLSFLQKVTVAFRMLAYGVPADYVDEYIKIGESTAIESLKRFVLAVVEVFGDDYLRSPNSDDLIRLLALGEERDFPGMLGSIHCMHWTWKNSLTTWHGMFTGHIHEPTIILEAIVSYDIWIWHAFFGLHGSLNVINVLERSFVFSDISEGCAPPISYKINGRSYDMGYYLAEAPQGNKHKHLAKEQEGAKKDVERAFGVLQARFVIVCSPTRFWEQDTLKNIMAACIIMHNMIIEDEHDKYDVVCRQRTMHDIESSYNRVCQISQISVSFERTPTLIEFIENRHRICDNQMHTELQEDLVEHLRKIHGGQ